jgi:hypothetical protein
VEIKKRKSDHSASTTEEDVQPLDKKKIKFNNESDKKERKDKEKIKY